MTLRKSLLVISAALLLAPIQVIPQTVQTDRAPAVAGQFYPGNREDLTAMLKTLFSKAAKSRNLKNVIAVISPHAGYQFSGIVAASAFNQIDPAKDYENIFILGPSHRVTFQGAAVYGRGNFITPLGVVRVNRELAGELTRKYSFFTDRIDAHRDEHSVEVQIPFLQYRLKKMPAIVPIVLGYDPPELCAKIAEALRPYLNTRNLFVISTDFSHYPPYDAAVEVDKASADAVLSNSAERLLATLKANSGRNIPNLATSMCGEVCVLTLLDMTGKDPDAAYTHILYKNSGDADIGNREQVVGYNAIIVTGRAAKASSGFELDLKDKKDLLVIARNTMEGYIRDSRVPIVDTAKLSAKMKTDCGAFVTLHERGNLRGCIGRFDASEPLYKVVQEMAIAASTQDYRFSKVSPDEFTSIDLEISVLTPLRKISSPDEIVMGKHGIYMRKGARSGTFLPQVATETGWSKEEFLGHCAEEKAGIGWDGWRDAELYVYESLVFSEAELLRK